MNMDNPMAYGFTNVSQPVLTSMLDVGSAPVCNPAIVGQDPQMEHGSLFIDPHFDPTALGQAVRNALTASSWAPSIGRPQVVPREGTGPDLHGLKQRPVLLVLLFAVPMLASRCPFPARMDRKPGASYLPALCRSVWPAPDEGGRQDAVAGAIGGEDEPGRGYDDGASDIQSARNGQHACWKPVSCCQKRRGC